jgi:hypothetical protein
VPNQSTPQKTVSLFFFTFIDPIIHYGYKHTLETENVWRTPKVDTKPLYAAFDREWRKQMKRDAPDIKRAVIANSTGALVHTAVLYLVSMAAQLVGPLMLQRIVGGLGCWAKAGKNAPTCPSSTQLY